MRQLTRSQVSLAIGITASLLFGYFAVPQILGSEGVAAEADAMYHLGAIANAESVYASRYPGHAITLSVLGSGGPEKCVTATAEHACLIEPKLATGRSDGYEYRLQPGQGTDVIWAIPEGDNSPSQTVFCLGRDGRVRSATADQLPFSSSSAVDCDRLRPLP
jgi:hypothetical protein